MKLLQYLLLYLLRTVTLFSFPQAPVQKLFVKKHNYLVTNEKHCFSSCGRKILIQEYRGGFGVEGSQHSAGMMRKEGEWWGDRFSSSLDAAPNVSVTFVDREGGRTC